MMNLIFSSPVLGLLIGAFLLIIGFSVSAWLLERGGKKQSGNKEFILARVLRIFEIPITKRSVEKRIRRRKSIRQIERKVVSSKKNNWRAYHEDQPRTTHRHQYNGY